MAVKFGLVKTKEIESNYKSIVSELKLNLSLAWSGGSDYKSVLITVRFN